MALCHTAGCSDDCALEVSSYRCAASRGLVSNLSPARGSRPAWHIRWTLVGVDGSLQNVTDTMPLPARLIDSALALARAELALVLVHTRELAVRAVTALLATIIAAAFAQTA